MANTTKAKVLLIAPELANLTDPLDETWDQILIDVVQDTPSSIYGGFQERAQRYLAAHYLSIIYRTQQGDATNAAGGVVMDKNGDVIKQYASPTKMGKVMSPFEETSYGKQFLEIRKKCTIGFSVVIPGVGT